MRKLLILLAASTAIAAPSVASAQRAPAAVIVLVDTNKVYNDCNACKTAQSQFQAQAAAAQQQADPVLMEMVTKKANFSTSAVPSSVFEIPAGYKNISAAQ